MTNKSCINCRYLANNNRWCGKNGRHISIPSRIVCCEWGEEINRVKLIEPLPLFRCNKFVRRNEEMGL